MDELNKQVIEMLRKLSTITMDLRVHAKAVALADAMEARELVQEGMPDPNALVGALLFCHDALAMVLDKATFPDEIRPDILGVAHIAQTLLSESPAFVESMLPKRMSPDSVPAELIDHSDDAANGYADGWNACLSAIFRDWTKNQSALNAVTKENGSAVTYPQGGSTAMMMDEQGKGD